MGTDKDTKTRAPRAPKTATQLATAIVRQLEGRADALLILEAARATLALSAG